MEIKSRIARLQRPSVSSTLCWISGNAGNYKKAGCWDILRACLQASSCDGLLTLIPEFFSAIVYKHSQERRGNWPGCKCLRPLGTRMPHVPLSLRHSWRNMDTSASRAPKLRPPLSSAMPSGTMEGCEGVRDT